MSATAAELEAALISRWDLETLAAYADQLQAQGDPRGELCAIDLRIAEIGPTAELATRRRAALHEWLGGPTLYGRPWHAGSFRFGFVDDFVAVRDNRADERSYIEALFASPAGLRHG